MFYSRTEFSNIDCCLIKDFIPAQTNEHQYVDSIPKCNNQDYNDGYSDEDQSRLYL